MTPDRAAVLDTMSADLGLVEWSLVLGCYPAEVRDYCRAHGLPLRHEEHPEVVRLRSDLATLLDVLHGVTS